MHAVPRPNSRDTCQPDESMKIALINHHVGGQSGGGGGVRLMLELGQGLAGVAIA